MSLSGTIYGSFSGESSSRVRPYISWSATQNIAGNYSDVTVNLYFQSISAYWGNGTSSNTTTQAHSSSINNGSVGFNISAYGTQLLASNTHRVYHNSDGTRTNMGIVASGSTNIYWGSYTFGDYVTLDTIPRRATITTANANLEIGNNKSYTLSNLGGLYVRMEYWIYGNAGWYRVKNQNNGTGTSGTFTMSGTDNNNMYSRMPNVLSASAIMRAYTYSDAGYSVQVGDYHDVTGTVSINSATNVPTFTTWTVANLDKNIVVKDKYENELITSSTSTLLGADTKALNGYSKVRATITSANKAVAQNYATMSKYRFTAASKYTEANWSSDSTVNIDIDNVATGSYSVRAQDSRGLTTIVNNSLTLISPTPVSLWGLELSRANGVDQAVTMSFTGKMWKAYFGGGTSGVENAVVCHWRYKPTTDAWAAQSWTAITGDLDIDANGNIAFSEAIGNYDVDTSYDVEVRMYDKVSQVLISGIINVGTPVMDITKDGVAFMGKYDADSGGALQLYGENIETGWIKRAETWTRTGNHTFTVAGDLTTIYRKGTKVRYKDGGAYEYGYVATSSYSSPNTTVTLATNTDYTMAATTITDTYISYADSPEGFPAWFNATSSLTWGGGGGTPTASINHFRFNISGGSVFYSIRVDISATNGATRNRVTVSLPLTSTGTHSYSGGSENAFLLAGSIRPSVTEILSSTMTLYAQAAMSGTGSIAGTGFVKL